MRDLRRLRNSMDQTRACTIAVVLVHSKLDYYNSLLLSFPPSSKNRLQLLLNSVARTDNKISKFHHITTVLKSLYRLELNYRSHYKVSLSANKFFLLITHLYLHSLLSLRRSPSNRSSSVVPLARPSNSSRLKLMNRSFYHNTPALQNNLPTELRAYARNTNYFALFSTVS